MSKEVLDVTGENLEDLLAYDDLFLDFFNCFLSLPVFPQTLTYNRLTGAFNKVDGLHREFTLSLSSNTPLYGPTDAERDNMLEWAQQERLPVFLRAQLFRELKLLKLLLRPLDNNHQSASRGSSRNIRGYSRATESYISSLSVSGDNSGNDVYDDDDIWGEPHYSALYRYQRPGSRALSLPTMLLLDSAATKLSKQQPLKKWNSSQKSERETLVQISEPNSLEFDQSAQNKTVNPTRDKAASTNKHKTRISNNVQVIPTDESSNNIRSSSGMGYDRKSSSKSRTSTSSTEDAFLRGARALSAPVNYEHFLKMPGLNFIDFEALFGKAETIYGEQTFVQFEMEGISEEQTETDMRDLEDRLKMTVQQVKEKVLGSHKGFDKFCDFLKGTSGEHLLAFWLECEQFKDIMEDFDDTFITEIRNVYFRNIHDKFKLKLTSDALEQIAKAANNMELSHTIFLRTQYDVLRRLRAYWVPRFLIHCEMTTIISLNYEEENRYPTVLPLLPSRAMASMSTAMKPPGKNHLPFITSISLVHSIPLLPEDIKDYVKKGCYKNNCLQGVHHQSALSATSRRSSSNNKLLSKERFLLALSYDKLAGGPFKRYLARQEDPQLLVCLLFWEDVTEYGAADDRISDRLLRLSHAWNIYNKFLSEDSPYKLELSEKNRNRLHASLETARDFIEASIFEHAKVHAVETLEKAWIRYLKEDLKTFLDCQVVLEGESQPSTAEVIEITLTEHDVFIKRPMPWVKRIPQSTETARARRFEKALLMAEEIDVEKTSQIKSVTDSKRKKVKRKRTMRTAYSSQKEAQRKEQSLRSELDQLDFELPERENKVSAGKVPPSYKTLPKNKQVMSMFSKFVSDGENQVISNKLQLYSDIEACLNSKDSNVKKAQASEIAKSYFGSQGKRNLQLNNENITTLIAEEKGHPKSATLLEIQRAVLPEIEEVFQDFVSRKAAEFDVQPSDSVSMSQPELSKYTDKEHINAQPLNKRKSRGKSIQLEISNLGKSDLVPFLASDDYVRPVEQSNLDSEVNVPHIPGRKQRDSLTSAGSAQTGKASHPSSSSSSVPKTTGRAQPTREDRKEFLTALNQCAMGHLTIPILYFYKYLLKHGPGDDMPQIDKDLFFYIEVQKFKDGSHNFADEEMLKGKLQSIIECFFDSVYSPTLQIDIPADMHQRIIKATQKYLSGKEVIPTVFDDAQFHVFKELLFFWAGFKKSIYAYEDLNQRPVNKYDKMLQRRKEKMQNYQTPNSEFTLPAIPEGAVPSFNFSLSEGLRHKESSGGVSRTSTVLEQSDKQERRRRSTIFGLDIQARPSREQSHHESLMSR